MPAGIWNEDTKKGVLCEELWYKILSCEYGNELSGPINGGKFRYQLND
jgi:hypothetical protein